MHIHGENFVYIMTNKGRRAFYVGASSELKSRILKHKNKVDPASFTARYNINRLVYIEKHYSIVDAIVREKQIKAGSRAKKIALIESVSPEWMDLSQDW